MDLTSLLGNVASGGVLGLVGTLFSGVLSYFQAKQQHGFRMDEMQLEAQVSAAQAAGQVAVAREAGAAAAFTGSQAAEASIGATYPWVNAVRALTRPVLTLLYIVLTAIIFFTTADATMKQFVIENIVWTGSGCTVWWFGSRQLDKSSLTWGNKTAGASVSSAPTAAPAK